MHLVILYIINKTTLFIKHIFRYRRVIEFTFLAWSDNFFDPVNKVGHVREGVGVAGSAAAVAAEGDDA